MTLTIPINPTRWTDPIVAKSGSANTHNTLY